MSKISSIGFYGIRGVASSITSMTELLATKIRYPKLSRMIMYQNTYLLDEFFLQECMNIPIESIFRDHYEQVLMISNELQSNNMFGDPHTDTYKIESYPVAVLNLEVIPDKKSYCITHGHFTYYLMSPSGEITPIPVHEDLKRSQFIIVNSRRERIGDRIVAEPISIKLLATTGWNKSPITAFSSIAPFDVNMHSASVVYDKDESMIYKLHRPMLYFNTPTPKDGFSESPYLPRDIKFLIDKQSVFHTTSVIKLQSWYNDDKKLIQYIAFLLKNCISIAISAVTMIPEGTTYQHPDGTPPTYRALVDKIIYHYEMVKNKQYKLNHTAVITDEYKKLVIQDLEAYYAEVEQLANEVNEDKRPAFINN